MADTSSSTPSELEQDALAVRKHRGTPKRALTRIAFGALVFAVAAGGYIWKARRDYAADSLVHDAKPLIEKADSESLLAAHDKLDQSLAIRKTDKATAAMIDVTVGLWILHGFTDKEQEARQAIEAGRMEDLERAERYGGEAMLAIKEGRFSDAQRIGEEIIAKGAVSERVYLPLGLALRAQGKLKPGREQLRLAQQAKSTSPQYSVALGDACEEDNDSGNAGQFWSAAAGTNPAYVPGVARNIMNRARRGETLATVQADLTKLEQLPADKLGNVDKADIALARSYVLYQRGKTAEAVAAAKSAIDSAGPTPMRLYALGRALLAENKVPEGLAKIDEARTLSKDALRYFYASAIALADAGKTKEALALLDSQKETLAQEPTYLTARGDALRKKEDWAKANEAYDKALEINENWPDALYGKGLVAWRQKKTQDATGFLEKAVGAKRRFPEVFETVGLIWIEQGAAGEADTQLQEAEKLYLASGADAVKMGRFYATVLKAVKGGMASAWAEREKTYRKSL